jgi:formylglycine-generating enzyme
MKANKINLFLLISMIVFAGALMTSCSSSSNSKGNLPIDWVEVPAGTFMMGSPPKETGRKDDETQYQVTLNAFKMSKCEITVEQFKAFVEATGYKTDAEKGTDGYTGSVIWTGTAFEKKVGATWKCDVLGNPLPEADYKHPVIHVSWNDALAFTKWMGCRFPTEAEWEYAARAGTTTLFYTGNCMTTDAANYNGNYQNAPCPKGQFRSKTLPVGSLPPNKYGLCDMHGNVFEWCNDFYGPYPATPQTNPKGPAKGSSHVLRGGSWRDNALRCRSAFRDQFNPLNRFDFVGFRIVALN